MNTFGTSKLRVQLVDPRDARRYRRRFRRDAVPLLERVTGFYVPAGRTAARGYVLLTRDDLSKFDPYGTAFQLTVDSLPPFVGLSIVQARCVTRGLASDKAALYLVELTDNRGVLWNPWFQCPTAVGTVGYNCRAPAYPQLYYANTLNSGAAWTWSTMVGDLWNSLGLLGSFPGLPSSPAGTPEGWWSVGVAGWPLLNGMLEHVGMTVAADLTKASPYTVVDSGAADTALSALQKKYEDHLEDDMEWVDAGAARVPKTVTVFFARRNEQYGTEETVRRDSLQWSTTPFHSVAVAAPTAFVSATGSHYMWDDFTVRYDVDNVPLAADVAAAATIAQERVLQYFNNVYDQTRGYMSQVYAGALPFTTGSLVDGVSWTQDFSDQERQGWKTEILRGESPPWAWLTTQSTHR